MLEGLFHTSYGQKIQGCVYVGGPVGVYIQVADL